MIWTNDYETVSAALAYASESQQAQIEKALEYARGNLTDGYSKDKDEFAVITVDGYKCIALITNDFTPIEICTRIFPFDEERIYPMQEVELTPHFKVYLNSV